MLIEMIADIERGEHCQQVLGMMQARLLLCEQREDVLQRIGALQEATRKDQEEIIKQEMQGREAAMQEATRMKRQRNGALGGCGALFLLLILL